MATRKARLRKPPVTITQHAAYLISDAEVVAERYLHGEPGNAWEAMVYAYLLSALRYDRDYFRTGRLYLSPVLVVAEAMKQRFGMTDDEFATQILGG